MSTINDTDQFLVQRGSTSYKQSAVDLMSTIQDTDLMLIQRGTESFKVTCEDVKDQLGGGGASAPVLDSVTLAQNPPVDANRYTGKLFTTTTTASGGVASTLEMTGTVTGALGIKAGSNPITANAYPGTSSTSVVLTLEGETNLGDLIEVGNTVTANVSYTPETDTIQSAESIQYSKDSNWNGTVPTDPEKAFNGNLTDNAALQSLPFDYTFETPYTGSEVSKFKLLVNTVTDNPWNLKLYKANGDEYTGLTVDDTEGDGYLEVTSGLTEGLSRFRVQDSTYASQRFYALWINDEILTDGTTVLTLPSEKDIKLFQVDDLVQGLSYSADVSTSGSFAFPPENLFDGQINTYVQVGVSDTLTFEPSTPIPFTTSLRVHTQYTGTITLNDETPVDIPGGVHWRDIASGPGVINKLVGNGVNNPTWDAIEVDGLVLTDSVEVKVISTNVDAKTITVDGGKWDASNQSEVWSAMADNNPSTFPNTNVFDGDLSTSLS